MHGFEQSITLTLPPMSVMYFKCVRKKPKRKPKALADGAEKPKRKTASKAKKADPAEKDDAGKPAKKAVKPRAKKAAAEKEE